jgi:Flp pilus assembly protein TadG
MHDAGPRSPTSRRLDRRGVASIEFAISGLALFVLLFAIANLGDLALTVYALNHAAAATARAATIAETSAIAKNGFNTSDCQTIGATLPTIFNTAASPPIPSSQPPTVTVTWGGSAAGCSHATYSGSLPGGWVSIAAHYQWHPLALGNVFGGIPLATQSTQQITLAP